MKIPKSIQSKMHRIARYANKVKELSSEVDEYFISNGINIEDIRSCNGISLEELEYGNDITDEFCRYAVNDFKDDSMWDVRKTK